MKQFVFITDLHIRNTSNVRTGSLLEDLAAKLQFTVDYANKNDAIILIGGDVFDKPSVPDIVKNTLAPILLSAKYTPISIEGNHDELYDSDEYRNKTSYGTWTSHGILKSIDHMTVDLGECIITNEVPVISRGKPQIVVFHGFLNKEDGKYSFLFQDIVDCKDKTYILLGHDHVVYDPLQFTDNIKIFRPGSFLRQTREEASMRIPELMHIRVTDGKLQYKMVPISVARPAEDVFKTKLSTVTKAQQRETYEDIINQIRNANTGEMSLDQALKQVASEDVCNYASKLLIEKRLENQHNNSKL